VAFPKNFDRSRGYMSKKPRSWQPLIVGQSQAESPLTRHHLAERVWDNVDGEFRTVAKCPCRHGSTRQVKVHGTWRYYCCGRADEVRA